MLISRNLYTYCSCCVETFRHDKGRCGMWRWTSDFNHLRFVQRDFHRQTQWQAYPLQEHPRGPSLLFGTAWLRHIRHHDHPRHQAAIDRETWWFIFLCWCLHNTINCIVMTNAVVWQSGAPMRNGDLLWSVLSGRIFMARMKSCRALCGWLYLQPPQHRCLLLSQTRSLRGPWKNKSVAFTLRLDLTNGHVALE